MQRHSKENTLNASRRQNLRTNDERDSAEAYLWRNVVYQFVDHITSKMERHFPHGEISNLNFSYFMSYNIHKLDNTVLGSVEEYFHLPWKGSPMQECEILRQNRDKFDDHEKNFNILAVKIAAENCEFYPNTNYMLNKSLYRNSQLMLLWTLLCFETAQDLARELKLTKMAQLPGFIEYTSMWTDTKLSRRFLHSWHMRIVFVVIFFYCTCFALCSVEYFVHFLQLQTTSLIWHSFGFH